MKATVTEKADLITVGQIGSVYGVKGWLHINSYTSPVDAITEYAPWYLKSRQGVAEAKIELIKPHGDRYVAKFEGIEDREQAKQLVQNEIQVAVSQLPELPTGEFYWYQLEGLEVTCDHEGRQAQVGRVKRIMATGANDVLVVNGTEQSVDRRERLIPYIEDQVVKSVDLESGQIVVEWDPDF